jgi:hypothetical protein
MDIPLIGNVEYIEDLVDFAVERNNNAKIHRAMIWSVGDFIAGCLALRGSAKLLESHFSAKSSGKMDEWRKAFIAILDSYASASSESYDSDFVVLYHATV